MQTGTIGPNRMAGNDLRRAALDAAMPGEVVTKPPCARFFTRKQHSLAENIVFAMRGGFCGHKEPRQHKSAARRNAPDIVKAKASCS